MISLPKLSENQDKFDDALLTLLKEVQGLSIMLVGRNANPRDEDKVGAQDTVNDFMTNMFRRQVQTTRNLAAVYDEVTFLRRVLNGEEVATAPVAEKTRADRRFESKLAKELGEEGLSRFAPEVDKGA